jgi:hypothetical protein
LPRHRRHHAQGDGIAIDINVGWSDYWRNHQPVDGKYPYKNGIPWEIVEVFEKHGFIWGDDTMHFAARASAVILGCFALGFHLWASGDHPGGYPTSGAQQSTSAKCH